MATVMSIALTSLAIASQAATVAAPPYHAQGSDPAWSLTIADGRITYFAAGQPTVVTPTPGAEADEVGRQYRTDRLTVAILIGGCTDRGSGRRYAEAVFVTIDGQEREGCGGAPMPEDALDFTSWHFVEIDEEVLPLTGDLLADDRYAIDFGPNAFVGYGGCNRFSAGYSREGDRLTATIPFGATSNRCSPEIMRREARLLAILSEPVRVSFPDPTTMLFAGARGVVKLRRTVEDGE